VAVAERVALVSGGTRGIGKAICLDLARRGFLVAVGGRTSTAGDATDTFADGEPLPGSLEQTCREIEAAGGEAEGAQMDLMDFASIDAAVDGVIARHGRIDVLVNNAIMSTATMQTSFVLDVPMEAYQREMQINFFGALALVRRALPSMLDNGAGRVVNMSARSFYRNLPPPGRGGPRLGYTASKAALSRLAGSLKGEYGKRGIVAFDVDPGPCLTEKAERSMQALGYDASIFAPLTVPACVVGHLSAAPLDELPPNGSHVMAQEYAFASGLHAPWRDEIDVPSRDELAAFLPVVTRP
jgi:NAD(P)-dependent dehydrogenase (short-subunit alcohol dehydrogenase family)